MCRCKSTHSFCIAACSREGRRATKSSPPSDCEADCFPPKEGLRRWSDPFQSHLPNESLELRMAAKRIDHRMHGEIRDPAAPLVHCATTPVDRLIVVAECDVDDGQLHW